MRDFDDRIRATIMGLVGVAPDPPTFESLKELRARRPRAMLSRRPALVAAAVVIAVLAAAVGVARQGGQGASRPRPTELPQTRAERAARTRLFVTQWAAGQDDAARIGFAPALSEGVDSLRLRAEWSEVSAAYGQLRGQAEPFETSATPTGPQFTDTVQAGFQRGQLDVFVAFNQAGQIVTFGVTPTGPANAGAAPDLGAAAGRITAEWASGNIGAVVATLDPLARVAATTSQRQAQWAEFIAAYGRFRGAGSPVVAGAAGLVNVPVTWEHASGYVQINFDQTGQVESLFILGPDAPANAVTGRLVQPNAPAATLAATTTDNLVSERFDVVHSDLDTLGAATLTPTELAQLWQGVSGPLGSVRAAGTPAAFQVTPTAVYYEISLEFAHGTAHLQIAVDNSNKIQSLALLSGPSTRLVGR
jgi:hypothetical protein